MAINFAARKYTEGERTSPFYFPVQSAFVVNVSRARRESSHFGSRHLSAHARNDA